MERKECTEQNRRNEKEEEGKLWCKQTEVIPLQHCKITKRPTNYPQEPKCIWKCNVLYIRIQNSFAFITVQHLCKICMQLRNLNIYHLLHLLFFNTLFYFHFYVQYYFHFFFECYSLQKKLEFELLFTCTIFVFELNMSWVSSHTLFMVKCTTHQILVEIVAANCAMRLREILFPQVFFGGCRLRIWNLSKFRICGGTCQSVLAVANLCN